MPAAEARALKELVRSRLGRETAAARNDVDSPVESSRGAEIANVGLFVEGELIEDVLLRGGEAGDLGAAYTVPAVPATVWPAICRPAAGPGPWPHGGKTRLRGIRDSGQS